MTKVHICIHYHVVMYLHECAMPCSQKHRLTCDLDDSGDPVYFTRQDCICVQDLHLHPYSNVVPMITHGDLQEVRHGHPNHPLVFSHM